MTRITRITNFDGQEEDIGEDGKDRVPTRCPRLKDREDVRVEDMAKERAAAKDTYV